MLIAGWIMFVFFLILNYFSGEFWRALLFDYYKRSNSGLHKFIGKHDIESESTISLIVIISSIFTLGFVFCFFDDEEEKVFFIPLIITFTFVFMGFIHFFGISSFGWNFLWVNVGVFVGFSRIHIQNLILKIYSMFNRPKVTV